MIRTMKTKVTLTLELDEEEAEWLHNMMQNPLIDTHTNKEDAYDHKMRETFFNATALPI